MFTSNTHAQKSLQQQYFKIVCFSIPLGCVFWGIALWCGSPLMFVPRPLRQLMGQSQPSCGRCSVIHLFSTLPVTNTLLATMWLRSRASLGSLVESWQVGSFVLDPVIIFLYCWVTDNSLAFFSRFLFFNEMFTIKYFLKSECPVFPHWSVIVLECPSRNSSTSSFKCCKKNLKSWFVFLDICFQIFLINGKNGDLVLQRQSRAN